MTITAITPPLGQITAAYGAGQFVQAGDFSSMVGAAASSVLDGLRASEAATAAGLVGKADVQDVVQLMSSAETAVQTVISVRDKVLSAYNALMSMPV
jgi:flagellar hook-basal body complex protein FliE